MAPRILDRLLAGKFQDPDGGAPLKVDTKSVVIARSLAGREGDVVRELGLGRTLALVSDEATHAVLGDRVERALTSKDKLINIVLPARPHPDYTTVERLRSATAPADALIAVGSGTINDLCKYASALDKKPYVVFGTAPSMNGYVSVNAAITVGGLKKSLTAHAPAGVFLDIGVLAAAPPRMIRSGLGDSLCRPTAQADWLLAHLLFDQPYREIPFALLAEDEGDLFAQSAALMAGDHAAMESLVRILLLSGFGTAICGSSQPASQGEHLISHYADMMGGHDVPQSFHGEQIAVTTLTAARLQETMLSAPAPVLSAEAQGEADVIRTFGPELGPACWKEFAQKRLTGERLDAANHRIESRWPQFVERISKIIVPAAQLDAVLARADAPRAPHELSWTKSFYEAAVRGARLIRNRYTFLDLAANAGTLDRLLPAIT
jgi:glycerol-1-phosphate dehydrogenase [NAD(P)+]